MKILIVTILCGLSLAQSPHHQQPRIQLHSAPDISAYAKISYPKFTIFDLGEISHGYNTPQIIKIKKKLQVQVPAPYPVKVPHNVPYPVVYKVPQIIKVPQVVTITKPVPVEVIRQVSAQETQSPDESGNFENAQMQNGGPENQNNSEEETNNYGNGHQSDWKGLSPADYNIPSTSYGVPFPSSAYSIPDSSYEDGQLSFGNNMNTLQIGQYASFQDGHLYPRINAGYSPDNAAVASGHYDQNAAYSSEKNYQISNIQHPKNTN